MEIEIRNFRGVQTADIDLAHKICLIGGLNGAGKTSIAQGIACALTGATAPFEKMNKSDLGMLVRSGGNGAYIKVTEGETFREISYPKGNLSTGPGVPPEASKFATGLVKLTALSDKDRAKILIEKLNATPTYNDLKTELEVHKIAEETIGKTWDDIHPPKGEKRNLEPTSPGDWDGAYERAKKQGAVLKARWQDVTGRPKYGSELGIKWLPDAWDTDLTGVSQQTLDDEVSTQRAMLEAAISQGALDEHEKQQLQEKAGQENELKERHKNSKEYALVLRENLAGAEKALADLPNPGQPEMAQPCPHETCRLPIVVKSGKFQKPSEKAPTPEQIAEFEAERKKLAAQVSDQRQQLTTQENSVARLNIEIEGAQKAKKRLSELKEGNVSAEDVEKQRESVKLAERRLLAFQKKQTADQLHQAISTNQIIMDALDAAGLRKRKLAAALGEFNEKFLGKFSKAADWAPVKIGLDLEPSYDDRPYFLLSAGEQTRVDITIQAALTIKDGSPAMVIDANDTLDRHGRNGVISLCASLPMPCVVFLIANKAEEFPNLREAGMGMSYWIKDGIAKELTLEAVAA